MASGSRGPRRQHHRADRGPRHGYSDVVDEFRALNPAAVGSPPTTAAEPRRRPRDDDDNNNNDDHSPAGTARTYRGEEPADLPDRDPSTRRNEGGRRQRPYQDQPEELGRDIRHKTGREGRSRRDEPAGLRREVSPPREDPADPRFRPHREDPRRDFRSHRDDPADSRSDFRSHREDPADPRRDFRSHREEPEQPRRDFRSHGEDPEELRREAGPYRDEQEYPSTDIRTQSDDEPSRRFRHTRDQPQESDGGYARRHRNESEEPERARVHKPRRQRYRDDEQQTPAQAAREDTERWEADEHGERGEGPPGEPGLYGTMGEEPADESQNSSFVDLEMVEMRHPRGLSRASRTPHHDPSTRPQPADGQRLYTKRHNARAADYPAVAGGGAAGRIGSMGPVQKAVRASAYSTLSVKSWSELDTEVTAVMQDLNKHFKPLFDKHGSEGVQVKKLRDELTNRQSQHLLGSRQSIIERLRYADRDGDDYLSYADFVIMITQDLKQERKMAFRGMMLSTLGSIGILPKRERDDFLSSHKFCPPPLFIPLITLIQVVIFAVYVADMEDRGYETTASSGYPFYSPLPYSPTRRWEAWRFLTYMFIHDGYLHIVYNVVSQLLFGFPLEIVHSWWRTAIIYLLGVAAGSLAHSVVDSTVGLVGASGGVYAILGAHLAAVVTNWKEMNYKLCDQEEFDYRPCCAISRFFVSAPFRLALVGLIVVPDTGLAIYRRVALDENLRIGVTAHVGGFLTGLFLGIPVLKNVNRHAWETNLGWITLVVFLSICAFAVFFNSFFDDRYPPTDWS